MNPLNNLTNQNDFFQRFNAFRQNFQGDPQQTIQQLLQSGKVTQEQYNRAVQMAQQFKQFFK